MGGGHYVADILGEDGSWYECDDSDVTKYRRPIETSGDTPYILFYKRKD